MQRFTILATISLAFLLVSPALAHAESNQSVPKTLNLALAGTFLNINSQRLQQSGGFLVGLSIFGRTMDTSTAQLQYSMDASVQGTTVSGTVTFSITGTRDGHAYSVTGNSVLVGMNPAFGTPLTDPTNPLACLLSSCTSEVPAFLVGLTNIQVTGIEPHDSEEHQASNTCAPVSGVFDEHSTLPLTVSTPVTFESAYMNPFGGPTVIASADAGCTLSMAATYTSAISTWTGVQVGGLVLDGTTGAPIGQFGQSLNLVEDLLAGTELDGADGSGVIALSGFASPLDFLNSAGTFKGSSVIPTIGAFDCSALVGLPAGTCTATGSTSTGTFVLQSNPGHGHKIIKGSYTTMWTVPAFAFTSGVLASVQSQDD